METEELAILTADETREWIRANLALDPARIVMIYPGGGLAARLVAMQIKSLQKAYHKLPTWYEAGCVLPPRAYEQASSERSSALKLASGKRCLDLTFGLGVDTVRWASQFQEVTALEPNAGLARAGGWNLEQLGVHNVKVLVTDAESFLRGYEGPPFDLIYADPDRRGAEEKRLVKLSDFSPNVVDLFPLILQHGKNWWIKTSPLTDLTEADRLFPSAEMLSTVSIDRECREVWIQGTHEGGKPRMRGVIVNQKSDTQAFTFDTWHQEPTGISVESPTFLLEPDPAFYHSRTTTALLHQLLPAFFLENEHEGGYFFSNACPDFLFPGRVFQIRATYPFTPALLKKELHQKGITKLHIARRNFPLQVEEIRKRLRIPEGGTEFLICTRFRGKETAFLCKKI